MNSFARGSIFVVSSIIGLTALVGCTSSTPAPVATTETPISSGIYVEALATAFPSATEIVASSGGTAPTPELTVFVTVLPETEVGPEQVRSAVDAVCDVDEGAHRLLSLSVAREGSESGILTPEDYIDTEALLDAAFPEEGKVSASGIVVLEEACA
jgi:hypothetical protein